MRSRKTPKIQETTHPLTASCTSRSPRVSQVIGNQGPYHGTESSLRKAVEKAADGMPYCATQVRGSSVGTVLTGAVNRLLVVNTFRPRLRVLLTLPLLRTCRTHCSSVPYQKIGAEDSPTFGPACPGFQEHAAVIGAVQKQGYAPGRMLLHDAAREEAR